MKSTRWVRLMAAAFGAAVIAFDAVAQAVEESTAWKGILQDWKDPSYWVFLGVVLVFGMLGGLIAELISLKGRLEWPHRAIRAELEEGLEALRVESTFDLGFLARMLVGGGAALVVLWGLELDEDGAIAVVAGSLLAGTAGGAVFKAFQGRLEAALAEVKLAQVGVVLEELDGVIDSLEGTKENLEDNLVRNSASQVGSRGITFNAATSLRLPELQQSDVLLGRARALTSAASALTRTRSTVKGRVGRVLQAWSGVPLASFGPLSTKIVDLYNKGEGNPALTDGILSDLANRLRAEFSTAHLPLAPTDFRGRVSTIGALISYVQSAPLRSGR